MRVRAVIHLDNLRHNVSLIRSIIGPDVKICAAVKADAYGHGAVRTAQVLLEAGVSCLGVAGAEEAIELREAGIQCPILVYSLPVPEDIDVIARYRLSTAVADKALAEMIDRAGKSLRIRIPVHLKIDSGMGRIGCRPEEAPDLAALIAGSEGLSLEGSFTHFPISDAADTAVTENQNALFARTLESMRARGIKPGIVHAANSGAILSLPAARHDMVRPGILLYGYYPSKDQARVFPFKPVMELETSVVFIKKVLPGETISYGMTHTIKHPTSIATLAAGYGDGYSRLLSGKAGALIRGKRYPVVGRICMDQCMADVGPDPEIKIYDKAVLFGPDPAGPSAEECADTMGTIPYEVTCSVSRRVPRIYTE
ncbi:MAG: alanine racemase [Spirochaetales bacterium]|nr:MAG: alanine racemase [Spirochaetales bacterium]